jgi:hypothetical protein
MTERTGWVTLPSEKSISAFSIAGIKVSGFAEGRAAARVAQQPLCSRSDEAHAGRRPSGGRNGRQWAVRGNALMSRARSVWLALCVMGGASIVLGCTTGWIDATRID